MAKLIRFLTRRNKSKKRDYTDSRAGPAKDTDLECIVTNLDNEQFTFFVDAKATGQTLEDYVYHEVEIADDKNYFGLLFTDQNKNRRWLDINKKIRKQNTVGPQYNFQLRVKFFTSDPVTRLRDEYTRYLYMLQLKQMLRDGEIHCESLELAAQLAAYTLQGEHGDYNREEHTEAFISTYRFLPEDQQTEEFEIMVLEKYKELQGRNLMPSICDRQFLDKCRDLPDYGVERHHIKGNDNKDYELGLSSEGILIIANQEKIGLFPWNLVTKLSFKKSRFKIVLNDSEEDTTGKVEHTFRFYSTDITPCKQLWKSCVEHHAFFRLEGVHKAPTKFEQFFRLKSRFHASFRTEYQMSIRSQFGSQSTRRSNTSFRRTPSVRSTPRASFLRNEADRKIIQQRNRDRVREESKQKAMEQMKKAPPKPPQLTGLKSDLLSNMQHNSSKLAALRQSDSSESEMDSPVEKPPRTPGNKPQNNYGNKPQVSPRSKAPPTQRLLSNSTTSRESSDDQSDRGTYIPTAIIVTPPQSHPQPPTRPGYAPIPPKRAQKAASPTPNAKPRQKDDKVILV